MTDPADDAEFALRLSATKSVDESIRYALDVIRDVTGAERGGVMLVVKRHVELAASSDEIAGEADHLQLSLETGPCLEAIEDDSVFVVTDCATEARWQPWCEGAAALGIRSVLSMRLATLDGTLGSINLYHSQPDSFGEKEIVQARRLGALASAGLASAKTEEGLREAMHGRHVIGLAQGILMERFGLDEDAAFSVLRRYSQDLNLKLRNVAADFVSTRTLPAAEAHGKAKHASDSSGV